MKKLYLQRGADYMMSNAVKMIIVSIYPTSYSIYLMTDQVLIQERIRRGTPITQQLFESAYNEAMEMIKIPLS